VVNNPRRGEEACGTSGMKAAINGVLNSQAFWTAGLTKPTNTRAAGRSASGTILRGQDALHASAIYYLLENEIVPMFFERAKQGPREWVRRMKQSLMYITPQYRLPAHGEGIHDQLLPTGSRAAPARGGRAIQADARKGALERARAGGLGPGTVRGFRDGPTGSWISGKPVPVRATIDLGGLQPEDVRVELVMGRVSSNGHLEETEVMVLPLFEQQGAATVFGKEILPDRTGRLGYALRVSRTISTTR